MFDSKLTNINMLVTPIVVDSTGSQKAIARLEKFIKDNEPSIRRYESSYLEVKGYALKNIIVTKTKTDIDFKKNLEPLNQWCVNGIYLQIGFYRLNAMLDPAEQIGLANAMLDYDAMVSESHSLEPRDHIPSHIDLQGGYHNTLFREGRAEWSRRLIEFRNRWMVTLRAVIEGRNHHAELNRFNRSNEDYFLKFPSTSNVKTADNLVLAHELRVAV